MFNDEANFFPSFMVGDVCGGTKIDLKSVTSRNVIGASLLVVLGSPMVVLLTCTLSLKEI